MPTWFDKSLVDGQTLVDRFAGIAASLGLLAPKANPTFTGIVTGSFSGPLVGDVTGNLSGNAATATSASTATTATTAGSAATAAALSAGAHLTKLNGIATGATANSPDATLLARANHTGAQAISTVTGLQTALDAKAPASSPTFTGTASFAAVAASGAVELGSVSGTGNTPFIDFHAGDIVTDYDCRIIATAGTGTVGQGTLTYRAAQHAFIGSLAMTLTDAADDVAAAAAGVALGALYRNGGQVMIRIV